MPEGQINEIDVIASWQKHLQVYGIQVEQLIPIRDWSESRVIRIEGTRYGKPSVSYLKSSAGNRDIESAVYRFAGLHPSFPAPRADILMLEGEEWLLLDRAEGILLADIPSADAPNAYLAAARRIASFHKKADEDGWTAKLSCLDNLKGRIETLPISILKDLHRLMAKGIYTGVNPSTISQVETVFAQYWPELTEDFRRYPESLIHGDCHYGNLFLTPEGGVCLIDWGSASVAPGLMDLAALVDVTQRMGDKEINEQDVLATYFDELSQSEREAYGNPERAWNVCRSVRAFLELEWFSTTGDDYGPRAQRELILLCSYLESLSVEKYRT